MRTTVRIRGNELALVIPTELAIAARLSEGTEVELSIEAGRLVAGRVDATSISIEELIAGITPENLHGEPRMNRSRGAESW